MASRKFEKSLEGGLIWKQQARTVFFKAKIPFCNYYLTTDSLIIKRGFFKERLEIIPLYRILDISVERGLLQRMCDMGTIIVEAYDVSSGGVVIMKNIMDVMAFRKILTQAVANAKNGVGIHPREYIGMGGGLYDNDIF